MSQDDDYLQKQLAKLGEEVLAEDVPERLLQALTGGRPPEGEAAPESGEKTAEGAAGTPGAGSRSSKPKSED
ncbi:hypothetical protein NYQ83_14630 [Afifella sp. JA880]|uniref:hypothetical protein n=1 Tax=Afifella sp. JA880 TaxID=2975280 RepID=UPI0021BBA279|nr:hypothetical protein [Afifella sp. JA880]MCT8268515.1 hypothetical protein [Afifella sp. JA880]